MDLGALTEEEAGRSAREGAILQALKDGRVGSESSVGRFLWKKKVKFRRDAGLEASGAWGLKSL